MVNDDINSEHGNANLDKSGASGNYCTKKSNCTEIKYKNVALKDNEPPRLHHALEQKTQDPQVSANYVTPLQFFMVFWPQQW